MVQGRYAATSHSTSWFTRAHAATHQTSGASALIGVNAAAYWGLGHADPERVAISAPYGTRLHTPEWLTIKRTQNPVGAVDEHGTPIAHPPDAVVTAYGQLDRRSGDELVFSAVRQGLAAVEQLGEALHRWGSLRGRTHLRQAVNLARLGCESVLEADAARGAFRGVSFATWVRQHRLLLDGVPVRLDMYHPASRTAIEIDGEAFHSSPDAVASDNRRSALLATHGIQVVRFSSRDVLRNAAWCRETARRVVTRRLDGAKRAS